MDTALLLQSMHIESRISRARTGGPSLRTHTSLTTLRNKTSHRPQQVTKKPLITSLDHLPRPPLTATHSVTSRASAAGLPPRYTALTLMLGAAGQWLVLLCSPSLPLFSDFRSFSKSFQPSPNLPHPSSFLNFLSQAFLNLAPFSFPTNLTQLQMYTLYCLALQMTAALGELASSRQKLIHDLGQLVVHFPCSS